MVVEIGCGWHYTTLGWSTIWNLEGTCRRFNRAPHEPPFTVHLSHRPSRSASRHSHQRCPLCINHIVPSTTVANRWLESGSNLRNDLRPPRSPLLLPACLLIGAIIVVGHSQSDLISPLEPTAFGNCVLGFRADRPSQTILDPQTSLHQQITFVILAWIYSRP